MRIDLITAVKNGWLIVLVIVIAAFLRLYQLNINPPSLTPDEAALGYNAYSILKTGKDEHGEFLPIIIESFGDYKPGLYVYFTIPFVAIMGLNEWSVRLPNAIAGIVAVFFIYKIVITLRSILGSTIRNTELLTTYYLLPTAASLMLATNPWHIAFSRGAWEANLSLTITLFGILFFLKGLKKSKYLIFSSFAFALTLITYQGAKLSSLIVVSILILVFHKDLLQDYKNKIRHFLVAFVGSLIIVLPVFVSLISGRAGRLEVFSVFSYPRSEEYLNQFLQRATEQNSDLQYYFFHSEALNFARGIAGRWFNHISGRFLFFDGDWQNLRHLPPNHGVLLMADSLLLIAGIIGLAKTSNQKLKMFVLLWLVTAPLPAVLSRDQVQAVRALNMVIPLIVINSLGLCYIIDKTKIFASRFRSIVYGLLTIVYLLSFIYFLDAYFVHQPVHNAKHWQYGYKQVIQSIKPYIDNGSSVIFQQSYAQPYIYYLFYGGTDNFFAYDPKLLNEKKLERYKESVLDVSLVKSIDPIAFEYFGWPKVAAPGTIIVGDEVAIPPDFEKWSEYELIQKINYPNDSRAFTVVRVK